MTATFREIERPHKPHLDPDAIVRLRGALLSARSTQSVTTDAHEATFNELTGQLDVDSLLEREIARVAADRARGAIGDIDDALIRLDDGTYGVCETCASPIPYARLEIIPHARTCVDCARSRTSVE